MTSKQAFFGAIALGCLLTGCHRSVTNRLTSQSANAQPVAVEVIQPRLEDIRRRLVLPGSLDAMEKATLYAKATGYLKSIAVDKGDWVRRRQVLAVLDIPEMTKEYQQALAKQRAALAQLATAEAELRQAQEAIKVAKADYEAAEAAYRIAQTEMQEPKAQIAVAETAVQEPESDLAAAKAELKAAEAEMETLKAAVKAAQGELEAAQAELRAAQAEREAAQAELETSGAELSRAKAEGEFAAKELERFKALFERKVVTRRQLDEKESQHKATQAKVQAAQSQVNTARSKLATAEAKAGMANAKVNTAIAKLMQMDAQVKTAQQKLKAYQAQVEKAETKIKIAQGQVGLPQARLQTVQARIEAAKAQREAVRARLSIAKVHAEATRHKVETARAEVAAARAELDRLGDLMDYAVIRAPFDGVVTARFVDAGALVEQGKTPLVTVMNIDRLRVFVDVPEPDVPFVQRGNPVTLKVRELPEEVFKGTVTRFETALDPATRTMRTEIQLANPGHKLRPGMYASVDLGLEVRSKVLTVPAGCLLVEKDQTFVFIVEDGKAKKLSVQTGLDDGIKVEITGGLTGDETVILTGARLVSDGMPVKAKQVSWERQTEK